MIWNLGCKIELTKEADTSEFEKQIDLAVYRLYGLSADEIRTVKNG